MPDLTTSATIDAFMAAETPTAAREAIGAIPDVPAAKLCARVTGAWVEIPTFLSAKFCSDAMNITEWVIDGGGAYFLKFGRDIFTGGGLMGVYKIYATPAPIGGGLNTALFPNLERLTSTGGFLNTLNVSENTVLSSLDVSNNDFFEEQNVNNILMALDANGVSNGWLNISGGSSVAPSGDGITAAYNLVGKGWTVITN